MVELPEYAGLAILALAYLAVIGLTTRCEHRYQRDPRHHHRRAECLSRPARSQPGLETNRSIVSAARFPAPIARITVAEPVTMSPPAKTPRLDVPPSASASM